jgi:molybdopterin synthase catalytic subunit
VSLKPGDRAVYIGTVRYHRNEFWEITKVAIVDDYDRANADFRKKFGAKTPLRKALLTPAK